MDKNKALCEIAIQLLQIVSNTATLKQLFSIWDRLDIALAMTQDFQTTADIAQIKADINLKHQVKSKQKTGKSNQMGDITLFTQL